MPEPLWTPDPDRSERSALSRFLRRAGFDGYDEAWEWSVAPATAGEFWAEVAVLAGVEAGPGPALVHGSTAAAGDADHASWFPDARLNYAQACLRPEGPGPAVVARSDTREGTELSWGQLRALVASVRCGLVDAGVGAGDFVGGYLPNIPETLAVMLAAASLGAVWTCCAPEVGVAGCLDRLGQCAPVVLVAVDGYRYGSRPFDRRAEAEEIRSGLPSLRRAVWLRYLDTETAAPKGWVDWDVFASGTNQELSFEAVRFDHPLYVLYSSGTTGRPKAIVHGHGGILLEHFKALSLHFDLDASDRFFWFTTTGWMMWNFCVSGLLAGSTVVLFDGDPGSGRLWDLMAEEDVTVGGVGSGYLVASMKAGDRPGGERDLSALVTLGATGSPLPPAAAQWVYREVAPELMLASFSGGTDVCTGFVGPSPRHPVWAGEISCRCMGAPVDVFDDDGRSVSGVEGELVLTGPMPSMPVGILGDVDGSRYRATYFERYPGVWAHGDRATLTDRGTVIITGRSDGTLNRGGVRMGTAELYSVVEALPGVADSLAVHIEDPAGGPGELLLFVVPASGADGSRDPELVDSVRAALRRDLSPRHVPDQIVTVTSIPKTLSGKKLEVPVKRILSGVAVSEAVALASVADPTSLEPFVSLAAQRAQVRDR